MAQHRKLSKLTWAIIIILCVLIIDQWIKFWIKTNYQLGDGFSVIGNWFYIHFTENDGMAFGWKFAGESGKLILSIFRLFAVTLIGWYLVKLAKKDSKTGLIISISLIFAGALGNILDSLFYGLIFNDSIFQVAQFLPEGGGYAGFLHGRVVDMFYFPIWTGFYPDWIPFMGGKDFIFFRPVFNIADASITVGVFMLIIFQKRYFNNKEAVADQKTVSEIEDRKGND